MHIDRLTRLENIVRADAAKPTGAQFDLTTWAAPAETDGGIHRPWDKQEDSIPVDCGTKACAFGLGVISGEFKAEGLYAHYDEVWSGPRAQGGEMVGYTMCPAIRDEEGRTYDGFDAAQVLFGITPGDAAYLFDPGCYSLTKGAEAEIAVADRIKHFCNGNIDKSYHPAFGKDRDEDDSED